MQLSPPDPKARDRSLMMRHKPLCDGTATGYMCKYYWAIIFKPDVENADHLHRGDSQFRCLVDPSEATELGDAGKMMPHYCTQYEQSDKVYDTNLSSFDPLTPEEIEELKAAQDEGRAPNVRNRDPIPQIKRKGFLSWFFK